MMIIHVSPEGNAPRPKTCPEGRTDGINSVLRSGLCGLAEAASAIGGGG